MQHSHQLNTQRPCPGMKVQIWLILTAVLITEGVNITGVFQEPNRALKEFYGDTTEDKNDALRAGRPSTDQGRNITLIFIF